MKHFYVIVNPDKKRAKETAGQIKEYLTSHGAVCLVGKEETMKRPGFKYTDASLVPEATECVITLGGDGTLIQAARDLKGRNIPIVGINLGTLGYLTQISEEGDIGGALDALLSDHYQLEKRMMLSGRAYHNGQIQYEDIALNEIVITRKDLLKMLKFRIYVNSEFINEYTADGIIMATPTGSTAYNLSAGGPIVVPDSSMMIMTPICSHALNGRSIVLPADDVVRIEILGNDARGQVAVFDGDTATELHTSDFIEVSRSEIKTVLLKLGKASFLDNLRNKMAGI